MATIGDIIVIIFDFLNTDFNLLGYSVSFFDIFVVGGLIAVVGYLIRELT